MKYILTFVALIFITPFHVAYAAGGVSATGKAVPVMPEAMQHMVTAPDVDIEKLRDPFASYLDLVAARKKAAYDALSSHKHEILEDFDLSTLTLVAVFRMGNDQVAMVQDVTGKGYMVRRGNYMGKFNGHISKIEKDSVFLTEQVRNAADKMVSRDMVLTLKEVNQKGK